MKMNELRELAKQKGIELGRGESKQALAAKLGVDVTVSEAQIESSPVFNSDSSVLKAIDWFIKKGGDFQVIDDGINWVARYRGAESSGSMSMPPHVISRHIELHVSRGALLPRIAREGDLAGAMV